MYRRHETGKAQGLSEKIVERFVSPAAGFMTLVGLLIGVVVIYLIWHHAGANSYGPRKHRKEILSTKPWQYAVRVSEDGFFYLSYDESVLRRFFAVSKINEMKQQLDEKRLLATQRALQQRRAVLAPAISITSRALSDKGPPGVLGKAPEQATDADFLMQDLCFTEMWLEKNILLVDPSRTNLIHLVKTGLVEQRQREIAERENLKKEVASLEPPISFLWLRYEGTDWVWEVVFWSLFGVIANAIIALILASRDKKYDPGEFVLIFPKIVLAPLLAIVVVSVWASGLSESQVSFLNLPWFLVFAFSLGFVTESLYTKLRDLGTLIVSPASTVSRQKLDDAAKNEPYRFIHPPADSSVVRQPKNLADLKDALLKVGKAQIERGVVTQLSGNS